MVAAAPAAEFRVTVTNKITGQSVSSTALPRDDAMAMFKALTVLPGVKPHGNTRVTCRREEDFAAWLKART